MKPMNRQFEDESRVSNPTTNSFVDIPISPHTSVFDPTHASVETQTTMEYKIPFRTMFAITVVLFLSSLVVLIVQIILYSTVDFSGYAIIDKIGIGIWGPVLFMLTSCALAFVDLYSIKKISHRVLLTALIISAIVSCVITGLAVYCTTQYGYYDNLPTPSIYSDEQGRKALGGIMAFASISAMVSSVFLASNIGRLISHTKPEVSPAVVHYTAKVEAKDQSCHPTLETPPMVINQLE